MKIFIMRHGEATQVGSDTTRALTVKGRQDALKVARFLKTAQIPIGAVWHSTKVRAFETAQVFTEVYGNQLATEPKSGLDSNDPVDDFIRDLEQDAPEGLLIVGHLPFVDHLVGALTTGGKAVPVSFRTGTLAALQGGFDSGFGLEWLVRPELLPNR
jgi:phosphohistidine phosphatase